jgi:hypothetical protein
MEFGRAPPTPDYPVDPALDDAPYHVTLAKSRSAKHDKPKRTQAVRRADDVAPGDSGLLEERAEAAPSPPAHSMFDDAADEPQRIVLATRNAIAKPRATAGRAAIGGRGKFRLLVTPATGERACSMLDGLIVAIEQLGWTMENGDKGYSILADGESIGFMIEEKLDRVPHIVTAAELREKAEYDRKCELADRGTGYRPWGPPSIPEHDYVPNGELVLKFDHAYAAGGIRRTFSDGKRQRLEDLVPPMIESLERRAIASKARREEVAQRQQEWAEQEKRRADRERQIRVEGYRITFLQRQIERQREIDGLSSLIATWQGAEDIDPKFAELVEFAQLYRKSLQARIAPAAIAERIADLKLMDDDVYIYDAKRLD